jgi:hypothetical protein
MPSSPSTKISDDQEHQVLSDGTPKSWIYFWSFEVACTNSSWDDSADFVVKSSNGSPPSPIRFEHFWL